jgi:hypothetical protein
MTSVSRLSKPHTLLPPEVPNERNRKEGSCQNRFRKYGAKNISLNREHRSTKDELSF